MRVRLDRTSCETSFTIFALSFGARVVNHFARRCRQLCVSQLVTQLGGRRGRNVRLCPASRAGLGSCDAAVRMDTSRYFDMDRPSQAEDSLDGHPKRVEVLGANEKSFVALVGCRVTE